MQVSRMPNFSAAAVADGKVAIHHDSFAVMDCHVLCVCEPHQIREAVIALVSILVVNFGCIYRSGDEHICNSTRYTDELSVKVHILIIF